MTSTLENRRQAAPPEITLASLNILSGAADWAKRRELVASELSRLAPDIIALQEVTPETERNPGRGVTPAHWLAEQAAYPHVAVCDQQSNHPRREAVALISRLPLNDHACLNLHGQRRVAQRTVVQLGNRRIVVANTHLFWQPGESAERLRQVNRLIQWLGEVPESPPAIIAGDFNGEPDTRAIRRMQEVYHSAYASVHGFEPKQTFPTPLERSKLDMLLGILDLLIYIRPRGIKLSLESTLDYIFVDPRLRVADCRLAFDRPADGDPRLYPSDHFGLWAKVVG